MFLHACMFRSTCLGFLCHVSFVRSSFGFVLMLGLCAHMLDIMSMVMLLLRSMCSCAFRYVLCLDPHPYMLICLDSRSSMFMCKLSHFHTRCHAYMFGSMFSHACVLGFMFSHAYMSRSMFSHACMLGFLFYMLYAIFHVLVPSTPCLYAQT